MHSYKVEFRDLREGERVLFETDSHVDYAWTLFEISSQPLRYTVIEASPFVVTLEGGPNRNEFEVIR